MYLEGSFEGLSGGDGAYPSHMVPAEASRVFYVGASRRVYAMREAFAALILVLLVALMGMGVVESVEKRTEPKTTLGLQLRPNPDLIARG